MIRRVGRPGLVGTMARTAWGGWIGLMYALQVTDRDHRLHTADAAD